MDWKHNGVKIVPAGELDPNTPQNCRHDSCCRITHARTGASKLWAGTVVVQPNAKTGPHHHGELETVLTSFAAGPACGGATGWNSAARRRRAISFTCRLTFRIREINALPDEPCEAVVVRSGQDPIVVNLDLESPEPASAGSPVPFHP